MPASSETHESGVGPDEQLVVEHTAVSALIEAVGPVTGADAIVELQDGRHWSVLIGDGVRIDVSHDIEDNVLSFVTVLGEAEDTSEAASELLLRLSFLSCRNGGLHAALDGDRRPTLVFRRSIERLDVPSLANLLENLARYAEAWSAVLSMDVSRSRSEDLQFDPASTLALKV